MSALKRLLSKPLSRDNIISQHYTVGDLLGEGNFSKVYSAVHKTTNDQVAIKVIDKTIVRDKKVMLQREVDIMRAVEHPNIISFYDIFETSKKLYLVLELVTGGELFERIVHQGSFSETDAAHCAKQILEAIEYLHARDIVHRDLKPENLLYASDAPDAAIKVADFGLSRMVNLSEGEQMYTACGTPTYCSPEILRQRGYGKEVDVWSIGVIIYILLCGFPPFYDQNTQGLFEQITAGDYSFPSPFWDDISDDAKDFVSKLLVVDPNHRVTATKALQHPWIVTNTMDDDTPSGEASSIKDFQTNLMTRFARRKFQAVVTSMIAANRFKFVAAAGPPGKSKFVVPSGPPKSSTSSKTASASTSTKSSTTTDESITSADSKAKVTTTSKSSSTTTST